MTRRHPSDHPGEHESPSGPATGSERRPAPGFEDHRGPEPGVHPEVARSGSSRTTAIALAAVLVVGALLYAALVGGIIGGG